MVLFTSICMATSATSESGAGSEDEIISEEDNHHPTRIDTYVHGGSNGCAIVSSGEIICWGRAFTLDDHGIVNVKLPLGKKAIEISVGQGHVCAVLDDSSLTCWGSNEYGQLGDGTYERSNVPVEVSVIQEGSVVKSVSAGSGFTCALLGNHTVFCWGDSDFHVLGGEIIESGPISTAYVNIPGNESVLSVSSGSDHSCALTSEGQLYCWGYGDDGRLGNGQYGHSLPALVEFPPDAGAVSGFDLGLYHTCAIVTGGDAYCSGSNTNGQLDGQISTYTSGDSTLRNPQYRYSPESKIPVGEPLKDIKTGRFHTCALGHSGSIYCWGGSQYYGGGGYGLPNASIFQIDAPGVIDDWTPYCLKATTDSIYCTDFYQRCLTCAFSFEIIISGQEIENGFNEESAEGIDGLLDLVAGILLIAIFVMIYRLTPDTVNEDLYPDSWWARRKKRKEDKRWLDDFYRRTFRLELEARERGHYGLFTDILPRESNREYSGGGNDNSDIGDPRNALDYVHAVSSAWCPVCGGNMQGGPGGRRRWFCPECGQLFDSNGIAVD